MQNQLSVVDAASQALHDGLGALSAGIDGVAGLTYPVITLEGLKPKVDWRPLVPDGDNLSRQFQRLVNSGGEASRQVSDLARDLAEVHNELGRMEAALAQYSQQTSRSLHYARILMWLVAAVVALHGVSGRLNSGEVRVECVEGASRPKPNDRGCPASFFRNPASDC